MNEDTLLCTGIVIVGGSGIRCPVRSLCKRHIYKESGSFCKVHNGDTSSFTADGCVMFDSIVKEV